MKKLLLLGGSEQQVIAIETAKRLGYSTVLCDYLPDNPGQYKADKFYLISTTEKKAIFNIAEKEKIDGVIAYASDPAAPTASFIAEKLGLPGNPYESVELLCNKDEFRKFLSINKFSTPTAKGYIDTKKVIDDINSKFFRFPIIIKPIDSSGSKGVTVLHNPNSVRDAIDNALSYSRSKRIVVEEYIIMKHPYLIGGDIFVYNGDIILWGLMNCYRNNSVNPLVPVGKSYPLVLDKKDVEIVKTTLKSIVKELCIKNGPMNVELIIDKGDRVYPIDMGPRSGGNMIPNLLSMIFDVDVVEMSVRVAMGEKIDSYIPKGSLFYATYNLHSKQTGVFKRIEFSDEIEKYVIKKCIYKNLGDKVEYFDNASKALGIVFLKFDNEKQMNELMSKMDEHVIIKLNP